MKISHVRTHAVPKETSCQTTAPVSSLLWIDSTVWATNHIALFHAVTNRLKQCHCSLFHVITYLPFQKKTDHQFNATALVSINYVSILWQLYQDHTWYQRQANQPIVTRIIPLILLRAEAL